MKPLIVIRKSRDGDEMFMKSIREQVDSERLYLDYLSVDDTVKGKLLATQYEAHLSHYRSVKAQCDTCHNIVEVNHVPVGYFIVVGGKDEVHLCDIAIDRNMRGQGIGMAVIQSTLEECIKSNRSLTLWVEKINTALSFYLNMGFYKVEERGHYYLLEWHPRGCSRGKLYFPKRR